MKHSSQETRGRAEADQPTLRPAAKEEEEESQKSPFMVWTSAWTPGPDETLLCPAEVVMCSLHAADIYPPSIMNQMF